MKKNTISVRVNDHNITSMSVIKYLRVMIEAKINFNQSIDIASTGDANIAYLRHSRLGRENMEEGIRRIQDNLRRAACVIGGIVPGELLIFEALESIQNFEERQGQKN